MKDISPEFGDKIFCLKRPYCKTSFYLSQVPSPISPYLKKSSKTEMSQRRYFEDVTNYRKDLSYKTEFRNHKINSNEVTYNAVPYNGNEIKKNNNWYDRENIEDFHTSAVKKDYKDEVTSKLQRSYNFDRKEENLCSCVDIFSKKHAYLSKYNENKDNTLNKFDICENIKFTVDDSDRKVENVFSFDCFEPQYICNQNLKSFPVNFNSKEISSKSDNYLFRENFSHNSHLLPKELSKSNGTFAHIKSCNKCDNVTVDKTQKYKSIAHPESHLKSSLNAYQQQDVLRRFDPDTTKNELLRKSKNELSKGVFSDGFLKSSITPFCSSSTEKNIGNDNLKNKLKSFIFDQRHEEPNALNKFESRESGFPTKSVHVDFSNIVNNPSFDLSLLLSNKLNSSHDLSDKIPSTRCEYDQRSTPIQRGFVDYACNTSDQLHYSSENTTEYKPTKLNKDISSNLEESKFDCFEGKESDGEILLALFHQIELFYEKQRDQCVKSNSLSNIESNISDEALINTLKYDIEDESLNHGWQYCFKIALPSDKTYSIEFNFSIPRKLANENNFYTFEKLVEKYRIILIEWIFDVIYAYDLDIECAFTACSIMDQYLCSFSVESTDLLCDETSLNERSCDTSSASESELKLNSKINQNEKYSEKSCVSFGDHPENKSISSDLHNNLQSPDLNMCEEIRNIFSRRNNQPEYQNRYADKTPEILNINEVVKPNGLKSKNHLSLYEKRVNFVDEIENEDSEIQRNEILGNYPLVCNSQLQLLDSINRTTSDSNILLSLGDCKKSLLNNSYNEIVERKINNDNNSFVPCNKILQNTYKHNKKVCLKSNNENEPRNDVSKHSEILLPRTTGKYSDSSSSEETTTTDNSSGSDGNYSDESFDDTPHILYKSEESDEFCASDFQLLAITAVLMSTKLLEYNQFSIDECVNIVTDIYDSNEMRKMERNIILCDSVQLISENFTHILGSIFFLIGDPYPRGVFIKINIIGETLLMNSELLENFTIKCIAASLFLVVILPHEYNNYSYIKKILFVFWKIEINFDELSTCVKNILNYLSQIHELPCKSTIKRFQTYVIEEQHLR